MDRHERLSRQRAGVVFGPHWPVGLKQNEQLIVHCDDAPPGVVADLSLTIAPDGDVWIGAQRDLNADSYGGARDEPIMDSFPTIRVRTHLGGGRNMRTRQALLWLALAMKLDAADQRRPAVPTQSEGNDAAVTR